MMQHVFTALIADDEPLAVKRLGRLLEKYDNIKIVGEAGNGQQALHIAEKMHPDVIFLDVEMPVMNGFELLKKLSYFPKVIFVTAFEEYAIKAFEENSVDYLLKPVSAERLEQAMNKLKKLNNEFSFTRSELDSLIRSLSAKREIKSIPVKIGDRILLVRPDQVVYFEAKDKYVYIVTDDNLEYLTDYTLASLEEKLPSPFLRIHKSFIINCDKIKDIRRGDSATFSITMNDMRHTKIFSGRSYADHIRALFDL